MILHLDKYEFSVLLEAAWGAGTGLRIGIMDKAAGPWYHQLVPMDRVWLFTWMKEHLEPSTGTGLVREAQDHLLARLDPDGQFIASWKMQKEMCYRFGGEYHISRTTRIAREHEGVHTEFTPVRWVDHLFGEYDLEKSIARSQYLQKLPCGPCTKCGERHQVQLVGASAGLAEWKCRKCKREFTWEP